MPLLSKNTESFSLNGCTISIANGSDTMLLSVLSGDFTFQLPQFAKEPSKDRGIFRGWVRTEQLECQASFTIDLAEIKPSATQSSIFEAVNDASAILKKTVAGERPFDITVVFPLKFGFATSESITLENCVTASPVEVTLSSTQINSMAVTVKYYTITQIAATAS